VRTVIVRILITVVLALIFVPERGGARGDSMWSRVFFEARYVAISVLMWPRLSGFLFELRTKFRRIRLYRRVLAAELQVSAGVA